MRLIFLNSAVKLPITECGLLRSNFLGKPHTASSGPPIQEAALEVFFREPIQYLRRGSLDVINCTEMVTFEAIFHIREKEKVTGSQIW
jgi:hypothetical protein